jgi:hypothetical protein
LAGRCRERNRSGALWLLVLDDVPLRKADMSQQCTPDELSAHLRDGNDDEPLSHMDVVSEAYAKGVAVGHQLGFAEGELSGLRKAKELIRLNGALADCPIDQLMSSLNGERLNEMTKHGEGGK